MQHLTVTSAEHQVTEAMVAKQVGITDLSSAVYCQASQRLVCAHLTVVNAHQEKQRRISSIYNFVIPVLYKGTLYQHQDAGSVAHDAVSFKDTIAMGHLLVSLP